MGPLRSRWVEGFVSGWASSWSLDTSFHIHGVAGGCILNAGCSCNALQSSRPNCQVCAGDSNVGDESCSCDNELYILKYPRDEPEIKNQWIIDHSIEIEGEPKDVWPWLAQMGNGRAGWYSYDWIDNLGKKSSAAIDLELVKIVKNQKIPFGFISDFEPNQFLTYQFGQRARSTYYLEALEGKKTRLWARLRLKTPGKAVKTLFRIGHFIMQRKQFAEIKKRVEGRLKNQA